MGGLVSDVVKIGSFGLIDDPLGIDAAQDAANQSAAGQERAQQLQLQMYNQTRQDQSPYRQVAVGQEIKDAQGNVTGYTGGSLQQLSNYGQSRTNEGQYIPASQIPAYRDYVNNLPNIRSDMPGYSYGGQQATFDPNVDVTQDPGYRFRLAEQENAINRNAAGMGKLLSGNRIEEIMKRSGEMASQEYGAARDRAVQNYDIARGREQEGYGRNLTGYEIARQNEGQQYNRDVSGYDRALTMGTNLYSQDAAREQSQYGRGLSAYERAYAKESDYLNHLRNLSGVGQTATAQTNQAGMNYAAQAGQNIIGAADARAAGTLAESQATQQVLNMGIQAAGMYMGMPPMGGGGWQNSYTPGGYGGSGMTSSYR